MHSGSRIPPSWNCWNALYRTMMSVEVPDYSRSRAVLVGVSVYSDPWFPPLPAVTNNLAGFQEVLTDPQLCGWPRDRLTVLLDPVDVRLILPDLRRLAMETEDTLLFYFAGHGTISTRGDLCLILTDTRAEHEDITGLDFNWIREIFRNSGASTKIAILDCCYSGRVIEALAAAPVADATDIRGAYIMTASDGPAHVVPLAEQKNTYTSFTAEFLQLIRRGIAGGSPRLTLAEIYLHLRQNLRSVGLPAPNQRGTDTADRFVFTRNAAASIRPNGPTASSANDMTAVAEADGSPSQGSPISTPDEPRPPGNDAVDPGTVTPGPSPDPKKRKRSRKPTTWPLVASAAVAITAIGVLASFYPWWAAGNSPSNPTRTTPSLSSGPSTYAPSSRPTNQLLAGEILYAGDDISSNNGRYRLLLRISDGNLMLLADGDAVWESGPQHAAVLWNQNDGNLVLKNSAGDPVWDSATAGDTDCTLTVTDDGHVVLRRDVDGALRWSRPK
ncbi:caspase family protein [Streptomyces sp. NPDC059718]